MLPIFAGIDAAVYLLQVSCLVVLVSVVLHGFSPMVILRGAPHEAIAESTATTITVEEVEKLKASGAAVILVDSRTDRAFQQDGAFSGAVRVHPDHAVAEARREELPPDATLAVFCA
jgi:hypothetical protein